MGFRNFSKDYNGLPQKAIRKDFTYFLKDFNDLLKRPLGDSPYLLKNFNELSQGLR